MTVQSLAFFVQKICDFYSFISTVSGHTVVDSLVYKYCMAAWSVTRMALSVQKMQIFDNDFRELFENNAASIHLLY